MLVTGIPEVPGASARQDRTGNGVSSTTSFERPNGHQRPHRKRDRVVRLVLLRSARQRVRRPDLPRQAPDRLHPCRFRRLRRRLLRTARRIPDPVPVRRSPRPPGPHGPERGPDGAGGARPRGDPYVRRGRHPLTDHPARRPPAAGSLCSRRVPELHQLHPGELASAPTGAHQRPVQHVVRYIHPRRHRLGEPRHRPHSSASPRRVGLEAAVLVRSASLALRALPAHGDPRVGDLRRDQGARAHRQDPPRHIAAGATRSSSCRSPPSSSSASPTTSGRRSSRRTRISSATSR